MAGQEGLGRVFNVVPIAAGVAISMKECSAITFVCTAADTFTITVASTFGGAYATPGNIIDHYYQATATNGTAAWTKQTQVASNAVVQAGANTTVITVTGSKLPDPKCYIKCTASGAGLVKAILHDLTAQQAPANLTIPSA
ncbi:hypothetical protein [Mycobacterium sp.]|uniref:hypothetical protein n=1 Tax=Mycobacterium sp. TaxID=1785 RepID=UPI002BED6B6F|nr:hypothetical protein [Mycobacterium sp.]HTY35430.1 hypothetical protein [Mycobacterium sp.]